MTYTLKNSVILRIDMYIKVRMKFRWNSRVSNTPVLHCFIFESPVLKKAVAFVRFGGIFEGIQSSIDLI